MLAHPEIPVRVPRPDNIEFVLKVESRRHIGPAQQLIEDDAVVDALDSHFASVALVKQLTAPLPDFRQANWSHPEQRLGAGEIDPCFLFLRLDLEQDHVLRVGGTDDDLAEEREIGFVLQSAEG